MSFTFDIKDYEDVTPLPLKPVDGSDTTELCAIMYSDEYKEAMGLLRALLTANELSVRAFNLTTAVIELAPAFYTAWNYRYRIVEHLVSEEKKLGQSDDAAGNWLNRELDWLDEFTLNNPKNYQIWSYREALLAHLHPCPSLSRELPIMQLMVDDDSKNYHVLAHRKWVCAHFNDWSHELQFTQQYITRDVYNNSAWSHRLSVWARAPWTSEQQFQHELEWTEGRIAYVPQNISSWQYLRGLCELHKWDSALLQRSLALAQTYRDESSYALEFYAHLCSMPVVNKPQEAVEAYRLLASEMDPIRSGLWEHKISRITAQL